MKKEFQTLTELYNEMYKLAIRNMAVNLTDVIFDTKALQKLIDEDVPLFNYWVVRKAGTELTSFANEAAKYAVIFHNEYCFTAKLTSGDHCENGGYAIEIIDGEVR